MLNSIRARISRAFTELAIFSFVSNLLMLVMPLYMLQIYDRVLTSASIDTLIYISMIAGAALLLLGVVEVVRSIYAARVAARLDLDIGPNALIASMESPRAALGDIQPVRDLTAVRSFINSKSLFALFDLPFAPLFIGLTWFIHPTLFWMSAIGAVVLCFIAIANQWATAKAGKEAGEHGMAAMISAQSFVRSAETLRAMGMVENAIRAWGKNEAPHLQLQDGVAKINSFFAGISKTLRMALQVGILGVGGYLVLIGEMTPGMIFAASLISGRGLQPIDQIIGGWKQFVETWRAWKRLDKATVQLQARKEMDRTELPEPKGQLEAENIVYFTPNSAPGADPLLKRISFRLEPGEALAIIGPSGAGKSTLARVLVGAVQARTGVVRLDGADTRNWEPEKLGRHIGYLAQEADILPGTIAQNIARFDPDANSEDVVTAAQKAQVYDLIQKMPNGFETVIGPSGISLSGGQKQRVGLARAFYGSPKVLVLDEPNANLDADGEAALEKAMDEAKADGATVIMITQRRQIAAKVDKILMLIDGRVEEFGTRDEVAAKQQAKAQARQQTGLAPGQPAPGQPGVVQPHPGMVTAQGNGGAPNGGGQAAPRPQQIIVPSQANAPGAVRASFGPVTRVKGGN